MSHRCPGGLVRNQPDVLGHVRNLQIHAVRAKILTYVFLQRLISKKYIETDLGAGVKRLHTLFNLYYSQIETRRSVVAVVHKRPWTII